MFSALLIGPEDSLTGEFTERVAWLTDFILCHQAALYPPPTELAALLEQHNPDAVVISLADYTRAKRTIGRLMSARPQTPIVSLHSGVDQQLLLELMQAGVREVWFPPFDLEQMGQAIKRFSQLKGAATPQSSPSGNLIAFLPARGGCGATTIALHTAAALSKVTGSALLADFDFHNSVIAFWMKADPKHGLEEALERAHWLDVALWKGMVHHVASLDILTAPQTSTPLMFSGAETSAVLEFARQKYQFVLVDLPNAIYSSCWEVLENASQVMLIVTPEMSSLYLARRKISHIVDHGIPRDRINLLLNRSAPHDLAPSEVEKFLSLKVAASFSNHYRLITNAFAEATFVTAGSKLGMEFARFAESLAGVPHGTAKEKESKGGMWKVCQIFSQA
jgi:pilus assembly protein CpaE